jgi:catechol 2,3-dioxygenase-like lactoylglutathione lyase family enzyme
VQVTGLFHAALAVWDLDRAETFYREVLGIQRHAQPSYFPGSVVFLDLGSTMIHLIRDSPAMARPNPQAAGTEPDTEETFLRRQLAAQRLRLHVAIAVDDLDAAYARVRAAGRPITQERGMRSDGMRFFYFLDTENNRVELVQHT